MSVVCELCDEPMPRAFGFGVLIEHLIEWHEGELELLDNELPHELRVYFAAEVAAREMIGMQL
jgi:hypothetical protein